MPPTSLSCSTATTTASPLGVVKCRICDNLIPTPTPTLNTREVACGVWNLRGRSETEAASAVLNKRGESAVAQGHSVAGCTQTHPEYGTRREDMTMFPEFVSASVRHRYRRYQSSALSFNITFMSTTCALCRRVIPDERIPDTQVIQVHHLRPEERASSPTVQLCRPCHKQIHALFTNSELRDNYDTIESLRTASRLNDYLEWIRGTDKLDIQVTTSNQVRSQRN